MISHSRSFSHALVSHDLLLPPLRFSLESRPPRSLTTVPLVQFPVSSVFPTTLGPLPRTLFSGFPTSLDFFRAVFPDRHLPRCSAL